MNWLRAILGFGVILAALVLALFCMARDRARQSFFDWLEAPEYTKNGERLYTHHGGDPHAK